MGFWGVGVVYTFFTAAVGVDVIALLAFPVGLGACAGEFRREGEGDAFAVFL